MFERFDEAMRQVLFFARHEASRAGGGSMEPEHLLLGLLKAPDGLLAQLFARRQVSPERVREQLVWKLAPAPEPLAPAETPFTEAARRALALMVEEADRLHDAAIAPEHLLLGLLREPDTLAGSTLLAHGFRLSGVREDIIAIRGE